MKLVTICFFIKGNKILLAMKKRGFGIGKWNGYGGKVQKDESIEAAAVREVREESGLDIPVSALKKVAVLNFTFENNESWDEQAHVFFVEHGEGTEQETEEMKPRWFDKNQLPFQEMWIADQEWLPMLLQGNILLGSVHFSADGAHIKKSEYRKTIF